MADDAPLNLHERRLCVIVNAKSGRREGAGLTEKLRDLLAPKVAQFELRPLRKGSRIDEQIRRAVKDGFDLIAVLGGDGTQSAAADALAGTDAVMAVLPGGTFNFFARDLGVGDTVDQALETLLNGQVRRIDVGDVNGRVFLNNTSFGAYPDILEKRESFYRRFGRSRIGAYWTVLTTLTQLRRPLVLHARVNGEMKDFETGLAFVAKNAYQIESLGLDGAEALREDRLAVFIARATGGWGLIGAALRLAFGLSARERDFDLICSRDLIIETRPDKRLIARDGEKERMPGPFHLKVRPDALSVVVPLPDPDGGEEVGTDRAGITA